MYVFNSTQYLLCVSREGQHYAPLCGLSRWTGQPPLSLVLPCGSVTRACHRAWEPRRSHVISPQELPLVWVVSICLVYSPHCFLTAWRSSPQGHFGERKEMVVVVVWRCGGAAANLTQAGPRGRERPRLLLALVQLRPAVSVGDNGGSGPGVWLLWCVTCVYANSVASFVCVRISNSHMVFGRLD